jgi:6-phosphogluconolactonase
MPKGSGPRHLAFHPGGRFAYCLTEYANTLTAFARERDGSLRALGTLPTLPADFSDKSSGAHIQINGAGDTVYVSNRGHNSIAAFRIAADGTLSHLQTVDCGGNWPRFFLLLYRHLIVANQESADLCVFEVAANGTLAATERRLALPKPVMILPI